jgi:hypothetical protein
MFLLLALSFPIIVLRDTSWPPPPPLPIPTDIDPSDEIYLVGELNAGMIGYAPRLDVLPFWGLVGLVLLQMRAKPRSRMDYDIWLNLVFGFLILAVWSFFVEILFILPSSWEPEWFPITPIAALVLVPLYRAFRFDWSLNRHGMRS